MMSTSTRQVLFCTLAILVTSVGCGRHQMASRMICETGTYPSPDKKYDLVVKINSNGIVLYEIRASGSSIPLVEGKAGSAYSKFYFMWDDNNNVWIEGEEAGRVILFQDGKFRTHDMTVADFHDPSFPKPPPEWDK